MGALSADKSKYPVKSLIKALRILDALGESSDGRGITELGKELRIGKSTVHRLLATLKDEGYVMVDPLTSRYTLGAKIAKLEEQLAQQSPLLRAGVPIIQRLAQECNETANLAILEGGEVLYIAKEESKEPLRASGHVGRRLPAHSTALGKGLLAGLSDSEVRRLYRNTRKLRQSTPNTIDNLDRLLAELAGVRREGVAYDNEEMYPGLDCIAAPVRDFSGRVIAALSLSVPHHRMSSERRHALQEALLQATAELSAKLGFAPAREPIPA
jgi:DNA-binding IclR family transcriptional regulator